jgi:hypothetical protein
MNTTYDVDRLQEENMIILEIMENFAAGSPIGNSQGATFSTKPNKKEDQTRREEKIRGLGFK